MHSFHHKACFLSETG